MEKRDRKGVSSRMEYISKASESCYYAESDRLLVLIEAS